MYDLIHEQKGLLPALLSHGRPSLPVDAGDTEQDLVLSLRFGEVLVAVGGWVAAGGDKL